VRPPSLAQLSINIFTQNICGEEGLMGAWETPPAGGGGISQKTPMFNLIIPLSRVFKFL